MLILRLFQHFALWSLTAALWAHAWLSSVAANAYDSRVRWGVAVCLGAQLAGTLLGAALGRRWPQRWPRLDLARHGMALLATALCVQAMSHVAPHVSIRALREEAPTFLGCIYPLLAALTPLLLRSSKPTHDVPRQLLLLAVFATALSGATLFLPAVSATGLALLALGWQLSAVHVRIQRSPLLALGALTLLLLWASSFRGYSPLAAADSRQWILTLAALALAVAVRPRAEQEWRDLLGAGVLAAVLVALCGAAVTLWLGDVISLQPALNTRLVLFRQHSNFLAPFFGFHAVLALGLALARKRSALPWICCALLLAFSVKLTDSFTGMASGMLAVALIPGLALLARIPPRLRPRMLLGAGLAIALLAAGALFLADEVPAFRNLLTRGDRLAKSQEFRLDAWRNSIAVIAEHPLEGIGPHTFLAVERFAPGSRFFNAPEAPHPHNALLYVAQSAGLPALLLFLAFVGALLLRLWRRYAGASESVPRALPGALLAALLGLLAANCLDLGLAFESVVPAPLILFSGLALSASTTDNRPSRPWQPLLAGALLFVAFVPCALQPLRALAAVEQAQLMAYDSGQLNTPLLMDRARETLEHALELDPAVPKAHDLLARWRENQDRGFAPARATLLSLIELAPNDATGHSLLGRLLLRNGLWAEAAAEFALALADLRGSDSMAQDRADRIVCLARLGRREDTLGALVDALRLDSGVLYRLPWQTGPGTERRLALGGTPPAPPIDLVEALEQLFARHSADQLAGKSVGYAFWMDTYRSFRTAGRDDRATVVLDFMEQHVPEVEPFIIAAERGNLAFDAGQLPLALASFDLAYAESKNEYYRNRVAQVRRALGENAQAAEQGAAALASMIEILDQPVIFNDTLNAQAENELKLGHPADAARTLERTLLFEDDLLARARLWERIADLYLKGGDPQGCERALREALQLLAAKPFPWRMLEAGGIDSMPARIARTLCRCWSASGHDRAARQRASWSLPEYFSPRMGPALFRLGFYFENAQVDQLLREADMQLLMDRGNLLAHWARLFALEASGRHLDLGMAMRALVDQYALQASAENQFQALTYEMRTTPSRLADPRAWFQAGLLTLLRGRYNEAVGMFDSARRNLTDDPGTEADFCGWQALAAYLASRPDLAHAALTEALALDPDDEMLKLRLSVIPQTPLDATPAARAGTAAQALPGTSKQ